MSNPRQVNRAEPLLRHHPETTVQRLDAVRGDKRRVGFPPPVILVGPRAVRSLQRDDLFGQLFRPGVLPAAALDRRRTPKLERPHHRVVEIEQALLEKARQPRKIWFSSCVLPSDNTTIVTKSLSE